MLDFITAGFRDLLVWAQMIEPGYIYLLLFAVAFAENIFPPIPGDTFTLVGGYLAATGTISLVPTFLLITGGTISSVMLLYLIGYTGGHGFFERRNLSIFTADDLKRVERWYARHGAGTLLASRFIMGARSVIAFGGGLSKYPPMSMAVYSYCSAVLFHGILIGLAYLMNAYIDRLERGFDVYGKIVLAAVTAAVILWFVFLMRRTIHGRKKP
jgi:membrane protein DedA with SNARE-associated domain